jgi:hypothetical protein
MKKIILIITSLLSATALQAKDPTLFVQQAKNALFTPQASSGCYTLTLIQPKNKVLYFASAPYTNVGFAHTKKLLLAWKEGDHVPNAALVGVNDAGKEFDYAFKISEPDYHKDTGRIDYKVCALSNRSFSPMTKETLNDVSIFIDPFHNWPP